MVEEWIKQNLNVIMFDGQKTIDWGKGILTPLDKFINMFGETINDAINENKNVKQKIKENDKGRGYAELI